MNIKQSWTREHDTGDYTAYCRRRPSVTTLLWFNISNSRL